MKIYVINMERSVHRRKAMEANLKAYNLNYEIIQAVDGKAISDEELKNILEIPGESTKSQAGCMLSHCKAYARMQQQNDEYALILEDDVVSTDKKIKAILDQLTSQLNANNITLLTYYWCQENSLELSKINPEWKVTGASADYYLCKPAEIHGVARAGAYILSKQMAKCLLDFHTPLLVCQADSWIVYYNRGIIKDLNCVYPMLFTENSRFGSEIGYTKNGIEKFGKKLVEKAVNVNLPIFSNLIKRKRVNFANSYKNIILKD